MVVLGKAVLTSLLPSLLAFEPAVLNLNLEDCPARRCLPPDDSQVPPLCFSETEATPHRQATQSFAKCPDASAHCYFCITDPPCETHCSAAPKALQPLGGSCSHDEQCDGHFGRCLQRVCRRALFTFQACNHEDSNDVCIFGQKSCFRGRCQGLRSGSPCNWRPEGRDIDCNPGWYCQLGVCSPQLPAGHRCTGQHPGECVRGYRCNLGLEVPLCVRQYTLDIGGTSSVPSVCKSNHVDPRKQVCAEEPPLLYMFEEPVVSGKDCTQASDCPRSDTSLGRCVCKRWWDGEGQPGYCELMVQSSGRPSFKRFWQESMQLCHHDWSQERCARELDLVDMLKEINADVMNASNDPTEVPTCGAKMLSTEFVQFAQATRRASTRAAVLLAGVIVAVAWPHAFAS